MGCCNEPATALASATTDPSQHVSYAKGMVLGVDDFTQEFAYLAERGQWLAREALGYGTLSGLRVFAEEGGAEGPRLHVSAGTALTPSGRLVCVPAAQCAVVNRWLARPENAAKVTRLLEPASPPVSPPQPPTVTSGEISLYLALCWADCLTRPVPIPGEPCRADDELMAPSRVADDFRLELRVQAPAQVEEDALRDFVRWLRSNVQLVDASPPPPTDDAAWLEALRPAAGPWLDAASASPPPSPPASFETLGDYLFDLSPPLAVPRERVRDFIRVALRFWVTELRPLWMAYRCHRPVHPDADCVLLARVALDVEWIGGSPTGAWQVAGSPAVPWVDETARPFLAHLRLLQEWALAGPEVDAAAVASGGAGYVVGSGDPSLPNAQALGDLSTGLLLNTVAAGTGTLSAAVAGTDYYAPGAADVAVADGGTGLSAPPADGQLLIGSAGAYVLAGLTGTANRVTVATGAGSIKLSGPQDLATSSSPTFAGLGTTAGRTLKVTATAAALTLDATHHVVMCTTPGITITLPPSGPRGGRLYVVKNASANPITLAAGAGNTVEGAASVAVKKGDALTVVSDGATGWHVIAAVL